LRQTQGTGQTLAVAIPTYLREQVLVDTIRHVLQQDPAPDEILVIDQTPEHDADVRAWLQEQHAKKTIRWITQSPPNLPAARNRAAQETRCDLLLFVDDDVVLPAGFVAQHKQRFLDATIAAVAGQTYEHRSSKDGAGVESFENSSTTPTDDFTVHFVDFLRGNNFSVRRGVFVGVGGFDESFVGAADGEEMDFAKRLLERGYKIIYDPTAQLVHLRAPSGGCRVIGNKSQAEWTKSAGCWLYLFRHGSGWRECWGKVTGALRAGPLRKEILRSPRRWPEAWSGLLQAFLFAIHRARRPVHSPWVHAAKRTCNDN